MGVIKICWRGVVSTGGSFHDMFQLVYISYNEETFSVHCIHFYWFRHLLSILGLMLSIQELFNHVSNSLKLKIGYFSLGSCSCTPDLLLLLYTNCFSIFASCPKPVPGCSTGCSVIGLKRQTKVALVILVFFQKTLG